MPMACDGAAGALMADMPVHLFTGVNEVFNFCVPAEAETVSVSVIPEEPVQAELVDAAGKTVAKMPYQGTRAIFNVKREKTKVDEVWQLKFIRIREDMNFQIGVDAVPLVSTDPNAVISIK